MISQVLRRAAPAVRVRQRAAVQQQSRGRAQHRLVPRRRAPPTMEELLPRCEHQSVVAYVAALTLTDCIIACPVLRGSNSPAVAAARASRERSSIIVPASATGVGTLYTFTGMMDGTYMRQIPIRACLNRARR